MGLLKTDKASNVNALMKEAQEQFGQAFSEMLFDSQRPFQEIIILCVGTDRITGDSLGPLTGYKLLALFEQKKLKYQPVVYGTLEHPVHAVNINSFVDEIYLKYPAPLVVVIDASLGLPQHIGRLTLKYGGVEPGAGVGKKMPAIGDIAITGVVNYYAHMDYSILQNTRLNTVMKMAEVIAHGIVRGIELFIS